MIKRKILIVLLFLLISFFSFSEENSIRMLLLFEENTRSKFTDNEFLIIYETLLVKLSNEIEDLIVIESKEDTVPGTDRERNTLAATLNANSWLSVGIIGGAADLTIELKLYDITENKFILNEKFENKSFSSFRELGRQFWNDVISLIEDQYIAGGTSGTDATELSGEQFFNMEDVEKSVITIYAKQGTKITGLGEDPLVIGAEGEIKYETILPATYSIEASLRGYYPLEKELFVDQEVETISFEQKPIGRLFLDLYMNNFSFFGTDLNIFIVPDLFYAKVGLTTHLIGFHFATGDEDSTFFVSYPLTYMYAGFGLYVNPNYHKVRANIAAVFFTRVIHSSKHGLSIDRLFPFGVQPIIGLEIFPDRKLSLFAEYAPYIYFSNDGDLMRAAYPRDYSFNTFIITDHALIELVNFRLGVRIRL